MVGVPALNQQDAYRLVGTSGLCNLETWDLTVLGTADPADVEHQDDIWD